MVTTETQTLPPTQAKTPGKVWRRLKTLLVVAGFLGLGVLNILTLVSDAIHAAAYNVVKSVLASAASESVVSKLLRGSTTAIRKADVAVATKVITEEKNMLSAANAALESKHATLSKTHSQLTTKHAQLISESQNNAATVQKVTKRIATRSLTNATRNATSVVGEAIPYLGIALILGVTTWDLYDACENMKDINEVNIAFGHAAEDQTKICGMKVPTRQQVLDELGTNWRYAYESAATAVNSAGKAIVSASPPILTLPDVRGTVCPVIGYVPMVCP